MKRARSRPQPSRLVAVATIVILGLLLSACGSGTESSTAESATDDAAAASSTSEPAAELTPTQPPSSQATQAPSKSAKPPKPGQGSPSVEASSIPDILRFSGRTVDGAAFEGSSLAGKPAVLWFWAPWCPTCRAQAPGVTGLAAEYDDEVEFVGVGGLDDGPAIADFAESTPGVLQLTDPEGAVWRHFSIVEQSVYVVVDAEGQVVSQGYLSDEDLAETVADLA